MRIAHLADLHLTERPSRSDVPLEEQQEILHRIADAIDEAGVNAVLIAGDCFDGTSTPRERLALREFLWDLEKDTRIIYGNHDAPFDLDILSGHSPASKVCQVYDRPGIMELGPYAMAVAPWPRVRCAEGYAAIVKGLRAQCGKKALLLAHCDLVGAKLDGGQDSTGKTDAAISMHDLEEMHWTYVAGGHYHMRQLFPWGGYGGGIRPMRFGDDSRKGVVIVDLDTGRQDEINCAGYLLTTIDCNGGLPGTLSVGPRDRVRLVYSVAEEAQTAKYTTVERYAVELRTRVRSVSIEPQVIPTVRVRAPEIAAATTDEEALRAYFAQEGVTRVEEIVEKAGTIE